MSKQTQFIALKIIISFSFYAGPITVSSLSCLKKNEISPVSLLINASKNQFYFTKPDVGASLKERYKARDALVNLLEGSNEQIEIWCYGFNDPVLVATLSHARNRGVRIDIIGSADQNYDLLESTGFNIRRRSKSGLQHAKVILVDRESLFSGTGNFTISGFFFNNNVFFHTTFRRETGNEIAMLLNHGIDSPAPFLRIAPGSKMFVTPPGGKLIQSLIVQAILSAKYRIRFLIFSHTDPVITGALYRKAKEGVLLEGIYDDPTNSGFLRPGTEAARLNESLGLTPAAIYLEGNRSVYESETGAIHGGHLHHKTLIIDDRQVLTGSYNWSQAARDTNLEVFYDFSDPLVAYRFNEEFEIIRRRSLLMGRSPFPGQSGPPPYEPRLFFRDGPEKEICWEGAPVINGFTIFSGRGPFFRADYFRPEITGTSGCLLLKDRHSLSAGNTGYRTYLLDPEHKNGILQNYEFDLRLSRRHTIQPSLPCEISSDCKVLEIFRVDLNAGWLWLAGAYPGQNFSAIRIFGRQGLSDLLDITQEGKEYYTFATPERSPGDAIIFLYNQKGEIHTGCIKSGKNIDKPVTLFLMAYTLETGQKPNCVASES